MDSQTALSHFTFCVISMNEPRKVIEKHALGKSFCKLIQKRQHRLKEIAIPKQCGIKSLNIIEKVKYELL